MAKAPPDLESIEDEDKLRKFLSQESDEILQVRTKLETSERVLARVTDGIYREPASALRELISNAYDADANTVSILTDAPRFETIVIRDDGNGMSADGLARLTKNIGGSAKRTLEGSDLGITSKTDDERSPGGRLLIGKIGIGLFSVSQLAQRFKIITKEKGTSYRLTAEVRLRTFSDTQDDGNDETLVGDVLISKTPTKNKKAHGTEIILEDVKPGVKDVLRSADRWRSIDAINLNSSDKEHDPSGPIIAQPPIYHSGWIADLRPSSKAATKLTVAPKLPWKATDPSDKRMEKLFDAVSGQLADTSRPDLAKTLDYYLQLLWSLALASPVAYLDKHPFEIKDGTKAPRLFWLSNSSQGQATEIKLSSGETVRESVQKNSPSHPQLKAGAVDPCGGFRVLIDGIELRRPIKLRFLSPSTRGLQSGLLFVGQYSPDLSNVADSLTGGKLSFEAYLYWGGRVTPKENNGILVRIRGSSGSLFDESFFKYQVSEQTRLRQITAEVFVQDGLDAALNIDRESFNFAHPHAQLLSKWVHSALRQLVNKHKDFSAKLLKEKKGAEQSLKTDKLRRYADQVWEKRRPDEPTPDINVVSEPSKSANRTTPGALTLVASKMPSIAKSKSKTDLESKAAAVAQILSAFGVLDSLSFGEQQSLIDAIIQVFEGPFE